MKQEEPSTGQAQLDQAEKKKLAIINALLIGCAIGVVIWGVVKNSIGFFTLVLLLYLVYRFVNSKKEKAVEDGFEE